MDHYKLYYYNEDFLLYVNRSGKIGLTGTRILLDIKSYTHVVFLHRQSNVQSDLIYNWLVQKL